eukprot:10940235-Alexandrium_andersonii.AAC.1
MGVAGAGRSAAPPARRARSAETSGVAGFRQFRARAEDVLPCRPVEAAASSVWNVGLLRSILANALCMDSGHSFQVLCVAQRVGQVVRVLTKSV